MATSNPFRQLAGGALAFALLLSACASSEQISAPDPAEWGSEAEQFFGALATNYSNNDFYGVLDFHAPAATVEMWRCDNRGGSRISDLLRWNSGDLAQDLLAVYLGEQEAMTLVRWPSTDNLGPTTSTVEAGLITGEVTYDLGVELRRSLRASPDTVSSYENLMVAYAVAWSAGDRAGLGRLDAADAVVRDPMLGLAANGHDAIGNLSSSHRWAALPAVDVGAPTASATAPAVYLGPAQYGHDPLRAVGVFSVVDPAERERRVAVRWLIEDGLIVDEERFQEAASFRRCTLAVLPQGWWSGLRLPGPSDEIVTDVIATPGGRQVDVHNGTPLLEALVEYGFRRFSLAGLTEPQIDRVIFEPSRSCEDRSGRVVDDGEQRSLFLCLYESEVCAGADDCAVPTTSARVAVLHELGHAWMIDHVAEDTKTEVLELTGRSAWNDLDVPWIDRGVEYAADTLAWGLIDERLTMIRLGAPPCQELAATNLLLTGTSTPPGRGGC